MSVVFSLLYMRAINGMGGDEALFAPIPEFTANREDTIAVVQTWLGKIETSLDGLSHSCSAEAKQQIAGIQEQIRQVVAEEIRRVSQEEA